MTRELTDRGASGGVPQTNHNDISRMPRDTTSVMDLYSICAGIVLGVGRYKARGTVFVRVSDPQRSMQSQEDEIQTCLHLRTKASVETLACIPRSLMLYGLQIQSSSAFTAGSLKTNRSALYTRKWGGRVLTLSCPASFALASSSRPVVPCLAFSDPSHPQLRQPSARRSVLSRHQTNIRFN